MEEKYLTDARFVFRGSTGFSIRLMLEGSSETELCSLKTLMIKDPPNQFMMNSYSFQVICLPPALGFGTRHSGVEFSVVIQGCWAVCRASVCLSIHCVHD